MYLRGRTVLRIMWIPAAMILASCASTTATTPQPGAATGLHSGDPPVTSESTNKSPHTRTWTSAVRSEPDATISVTVTGGCPAALGHASDVAAGSAVTPGRLLPADAEPTAGLICEYAHAVRSGVLRSAHTATVHLPRQDADRLARAVNEVSLKPLPTGPHTCPGSSSGTAIIAFTYPSQQTVDLWYHAFGCSFLDNGQTVTHYTDNPSFLKFTSTFDALAPSVTS